MGHYTWYKTWAEELLAKIILEGIALIVRGGQPNWKVRLPKYTNSSNSHAPRFTFNGKKYYGFGGNANFGMCESLLFF